jgi:TRAP-type C4-dicarboxylate transport system permease large subunit
MAPLLKALWPFIVAEMAAILLLTAFPGLSTWLPTLLR